MTQTAGSGSRCWTSTSPTSRPAATRWRRPRSELGGLDIVVNCAGLMSMVHESVAGMRSWAPGAVDTELNDHITDDESREKSKQSYASMDSLQADDIAAAILYTVTQPARVAVNEVLVRPTDQTNP